MTAGDGALVLCDWGRDWGPGLRHTALEHPRGAVRHALAQTEFVLSDSGPDPYP
jgi:hypothetical protein